MGETILEDFELKTTTTILSSHILCTSKNSEVNKTTARCR